MSFRVIGRSSIVATLILLSISIQGSMAESDFTQMDLSPRLVQIGVETEITVTYAEMPHDEGEGKVIRGYLPVFQGAVSIIRYWTTDPNGVGKLAFEWRVIIKPDELGSIEVIGEDETGTIHVENIDVVHELPEPSLEPKQSWIQRALPYSTMVLLALLAIVAYVIILRFRKRNVSQPANTAS